MKTCSKCKEEKLFVEFSRRTASASGYRSQCKDCVKQYREANKENILDYWKQHYESNKERITGRHRKYRKENPAKTAYLTAKRRATKLQATPNWLTLQERQQIKDIYKEAHVMKLAEGKDYHVDHIVPLQGQNVCGLHVPWNLQILEASENRTKSNKLLED
jgi:hypothetical protein